MITQEWTVAPKIPFGARNIRITTSGVMGCSGEILILDAIHVTFDLPDPKEEEPLPLYGVTPQVTESHDGEWCVWIISEDDKWDHTSPWFKTRKEAISEWNKFVRRFDSL